MSDEQLVFHLRLPAEQHRWLRVLAQLKGAGSINDVIVAAIGEHIERRRADPLFAAALAGLSEDLADALQLLKSMREQLEGGGQ